MPEISVIVPIFNVEKYLQRCIDSLLNQTLKDIEIILVDDGSPDNCPAMCDEYARQDSRVKVIHKKNEGLGFARNSGLSVANGKYVAFVDSDDYVAAEMYEKLLLTATNENLDTVYCGFSIVDSCGCVINTINEVNELTIFEENVKNLLLDMVGSTVDFHRDRKYEMCVWRAIYSLDTIKKNGIIFCSERELISEDIIFHIDYLPRALKVGFLPASYYFYCMNENSLTMKFKIGRFQKDKILHDEIKRKLSHIFNLAEYENRVERSFIGYTRSCVYKRSTKGLEKRTVKDEIKKICYDNELQKILKKYPYKKLPLKQRILINLIRYKLIVLIQILRDFKL